MKSGACWDDLLRLDPHTLLLGRLRHCIRTVEQENCHLLVGLLADIHRPMNAGAGLLPVNLSGRDLNPQALTAISVLDQEEITT